jgi:hypothetical protein
MHLIHTAGYAGRSPEQLRRAVKNLGARVLDIRHKPVSRQAPWRRDQLMRVFGKDYEHLPQLGNPGAFDDGPMRLSDERGGIAYVLEQAKTSPLILLCGCADARTCHRSLVARLLQEQGAPTRELVWPEIEKRGFYKAISLWQPHASLVIIGAKGVETRTWESPIRGRVVMHAAKTMRALDLCGLPYFWEAFDKAGLWQLPEAQLANFSLRQLQRCYCEDLTQKQRLEWLPLPLGALLGVADIVKCVPGPELAPTLSAQERAFGGYEEGKWGWILENVQAFDVPLPYVGEQNFFNVDALMIDEALSSPAACHDIAASLAGVPA